MLIGKAILAGNFVSGFKAFQVPDDETTITFFLGRVPESRLVEVHDYEALMDQYNPEPAPAPEVAPDEETDDGDGAAVDGPEDAADGDSAVVEDSVSQ